jgi:hypothetical protein
MYAYREPGSQMKMLYICIIWLSGGEHESYSSEILDGYATAADGGCDDGTARIDAGSIPELV